MTNHSIDPLHRESGPKTAWTRVNIAEGIPGISTPLNWSWWDDANERMIRGAYFDLGVLASVELPDPRQVDERTSAIFFGRPALNVDVSRRMADLQPGTSGAALERHYFGAVRDDAPSNPSRRRYPVILFKLPGQWRGVPRLLDRLYRENHAWWRSVVAPRSLDSVAVAHEVFEEARKRSAEVSRPHSVLALLAGALIQQVSVLAEKAGQPELVLDVLGGYESVEFDTLAELFSVKRGAITLEDFLASRGYQGPQQGELSSRSWHTDPTPIRAILESLDPAQDPAGGIAAKQARKRREAEEAIYSGLGPLWRLFARWLFSEAARMLPARETGKAAMTLCMDAARTAARRIGSDYVQRNLIDDPEDVFYLTLEELRKDPPSDARTLVAGRRAQREGYSKLDLPESWIGQAEPLEQTGDETEIALGGLGVSPGVAEGLVRIVEDGAGELHPGEILVCEATDPSYAAYFMVASGVVTEIGGAMGHGAIVAREVGIPCVVNARDVLRRLQTGDRIRIDGTTGSIEILEDEQDQERGAG